MSNQEIVRILSEIAAILDMEEVAFKPQAYERAAYSIQTLSEGLDEIYRKGGIKALEEIPGVGASIAEKIEEYIKTGKIKEYISLKKKFPVDIYELNQIEGIGPQLIKKLYQKLKIKSIADLKEAVEKGKLKDLPGLGVKSEQKIARSLQYISGLNKRFLLDSALPLARKMISKLLQVPGVKKAEYAGSLRRMQETVGDLDILAISDDPEKVMDFFARMPEVSDVVAKGPTKTSVRLHIGMDADLRVVPPESFGAALQYFTGDKYHNVALREIAIKKGYKLNEYGLFSVRGKKEELVAARTEEEIYKTLGLKMMPAEIRTNNGELEASISGKLPNLVNYGDILGDMQIQTDWTDGDNSIKEMAEAAKKEGREYIVITDHTKTLAMTGGSDEKKLERQMAEIDKVQKEVAGIKILKGAEVNILKDGSLDINDETLAKLDVVGAAVHSHFNMEEKEMTERISRAMENPNVDIIFHPTGRLIQKREPYKIDMDRVIKKAKETKTTLEIDAFPDRLDLKDEYVRKAVDTGVKLSIDTDAHSTDHLRYMEYGIGQARRGWAEKKDIVNAHGWEKMLEMLK